MSHDDLFHKAASGDRASLAKLSAMATLGEPDAMFHMGRLFDVRTGESHPVDLFAARKWYEKAANQGHPLAQFALGNMYDYGDGGKQDDEMAKHWYQASALQNVRGAQMNYARMLETGRGGDQSKEEAAKWYEKAFEQGDELAATNLGALHFRHDLPRSSDESAFRFFTFAAEKLDGLAHYYLGEMYLNGRAVVQHGGMALFHYSIAALLLPPGTNRQAALGRKEQILAQHPGVGEEFDMRARTYLSTKNSQSNLGESPGKAGGLPH